VFRYSIGIDLYFWYIRNYLFKRIKEYHDIANRLYHIHCSAEHNHIVYYRYCNNKTLQLDWLESIHNNEYQLMV